ncbi:MAG: hypothetical protein ACXU7O_10150, partial [Croceibacterium sp.]
IARQAGIPELPLAESELGEGRWQIVRTPEAARASEPAWLRRRLPPISPFRPTPWLARTLVRRFWSSWIGNRRVAAGLIAVVGLILCAAIAAAWFGFAAVGFAALLPAALVIETSDAFRLLGRSVFQAETKASRLSFILRLMWDGAFVALGVLSIDGSRAHRLFTPLVAGGLLHTPPTTPATGWRALMADRGFLAFLLAIAAAFGFVEGGYMILALALIGVRIAGPPEQLG